MAPAPTAYPAATSATAAARWAEPVSSAAPTWATAYAADSSGRPRAKMITNHQKFGLAAEAAVMASPRPQATRITLRRPTRSAIPANGSPPSEASRMMASPMPSSVPDRPAWSVIEIAVGDVAEMLGHVTKGCGQAELPESGGQGDQTHADDRRVPPPPTSSWPGMLPAANSPTIPMIPPADPRAMGAAPVRSPGVAERGCVEDSRSAVGWLHGCAATTRPERDVEQDEQDECDDRCAEQIPGPRSEHP